MVLGASATDDAAVEAVEFYANGELLGTDSTAPYSANLGNVRFGGYSLTAVALDTAGLRATSAPVAIDVVLEPNVVTLLPNRSCWKYWDQGVEPSAGWREADYDDSAWPLGLAELGYGDGDEATIVSFGPNANSKYICFLVVLFV